MNKFIKGYVKIFSREDFINNINKLPRNIAIISIFNHPKDALLTPEFMFKNDLNDVPFLSMWFNDITEDDYKKCSNHVKETIRLFSIEDAKLIIEFVKKSKAYYYFVQCECGESRSGAVGLWIHHYINCYSSNHCGIFYGDNPSADPNPYIFKLLMRVSGMDKEYNNVIEKIKSDTWNDLKIN